MNTAPTTDHGSLDSFDAALVGELRQVVVDRRAPQTSVRRRRRPAVVVAGVAAATAAVFGLTSLGGTSAAFAVDRTDSGAIQISIHRLDDAAGLEKALAGYGIDAKVDYQPMSSTPGSSGNGVGAPEISQADPSGSGTTQEGSSSAATGATGSTPSTGGALDSACGDPENPPLTADLQGDDYVITIPKGSALTKADSALRITTTGNIADSVAGLSVGYSINGVSCGMGSVTASAGPAS